MGSLCRFTSLHSLVDLLQRQQLTFSSPALQDDPFENYVMALAKLPAGAARIREVLRRSIKGEFVESEIGMLQHMDVTVFGRCWTKTAESDVLWRICSNQEMANLN